MAGRERKPPDRRNIKTYKCHKDTSFQSLVCIVCEDVYHINDFTRSNSGITISDTLAVCKEHKDLDLTSKSSEDHVLTSESRKLIASIKNNAKLEIEKRDHQIKELKKIIQEKYEEIQEKENFIHEQEQTIEQLQQKTKQVHSESLMDLDDADQDELVFKKADFENIKMENEYLKKLAETLTDKNQLLQELLKKEKESANISSSKNTYAEVASKIYTQKKPKRIPRISIKKTKKQGTLQDLKQQIAHCLIKDKTIKTNKIFEKGNKEEILVNCCDSDSVKKAVEIIHNDLSNMCNVMVEELNKPKVKIVGIQNLENMDEEQLKMDIIERNFTDFEEKDCTILHTYINRHKGTQSVLIQVTGQMYKHIRENYNKIYVGHQKCRVYDLIGIKPCYNCGRYGHNGHFCRNLATCIKCAGAHKGSECEAHELVCANCDYSNKRFHTKYQVDHEATNYERCEIFKAKVKKYIDSTDYQVDPVLPKEYVGNTDNYINSPMSAKNSGQSAESLNILNNKITKNLANKN